jgi:chromosome segregation ATPase
MSAYVNGRNNRIIPLTEVADSIQSELSNEVPEILPPLPKIENDIQAYTTLARKIEAALIQEKSNSKQYREDLILFQQKYNRFVGEVETQFREHLLREEQLKAQISNYQQIEKSTQLQMNDLLRELSSLRDFKKKAELEMELMRTTIETTKHREGMLQNSLSSVQTNEKTHLQRIEELTKELGTVQKELNRYQASWGQVSGYHQRAKQIQIDLRTGTFGGALWSSISGRWT